MLLGHAELGAKNWSGAVEAYGRSLELRLSSAFGTDGGAILLGLAVAAAGLRHLELAATLAGAADGQAWGGERRDAPSGDHRPVLAAAARQLGDAWTPMFEAGGRLTMNQVEALAAEAVEELSAPASVGLTAREREVIQLVAEGLSNPDIAERTEISRRTVDAHLRSIFATLGVSSRPAAVHAAGDAGLL